MKESINTYGLTIPLLALAAIECLLVTFPAGVSTIGELGQIVAAWEITIFSWESERDDWEMELSEGVGTREEEPRSIVVEELKTDGITGIKGRAEVT